MPVQLPCGKCLGCRADQALMWSIRAYHESTQHEYNCFVTLTYDEEHLPHDNKISKKHLQDFFKRLRKSVTPLRLRYIACGEYGEQTRRPHYHAIIFGTDFLHDKKSISDTLYTSSTLETAWGQGFVTVAPVTFASICYTCGYVVKKIGDEDTFSLMSRRPGIGHDWLDRYSDDIRRTGVVVINGRELPVPPRYLMWKEDELQEVKAARRRYALMYEKDFDPIERRQHSDAREKNRSALIKQKVEKL